MKRLLLLVAMAMATCSARAESRDPNNPYTPRQLQEMSTLVFEGTVAEIETPAGYKESFPTKALISKVVKGQLDAKEITFKHKHPSKNIILEKEYNTPTVGQSGTFYLQDQAGTLVLIGYIKKIEPPAAGDGKPAPRTELQGFTSGQARIQVGMTKAEVLGQIAIKPRNTDLKE